LSAAVIIGGNSNKATIDTGATASFVSEKMADNIAALGRITRTRQQVRLADGRWGGINAQLKVEVKFGNFVDFLQINAKSVKDAYPMPRINHILVQLREARYISKSEGWILADPTGRE